jgi:hypothetical protein
MVDLAVVRCDSRHFILLVGLQSSAVLVDHVFSRVWWSRSCAQVPEKEVSAVFCQESLSDTNEMAALLLLKQSCEAQLKLLLASQKPLSVPHAEYVVVFLCVRSAIAHLPWLFRFASLLSFFLLRVPHWIGFALPGYSVFVCSCSCRSSLASLSCVLRCVTCCVFVFGVVCVCVHVCVCVCVCCGWWFTLCLCMCVCGWWMMGCCVCVCVCVCLFVWSVLRPQNHRRVQGGRDSQPEPRRRLRHRSTGGVAQTYQEPQSSPQEKVTLSALQAPHSNPTHSPSLTICPSPVVPGGHVSAVRSPKLCLYHPMRNEVANLVAGTSDL